VEFVHIGVETAVSAFTVAERDVDIEKHKRIIASAGKKTK